MVTTFLSRNTPKRAQASFAPGAQHELIVPPGPGSRPGVRLLAPSRSTHRLGRMDAHLCREDFTVIMGSGGSVLRPKMFGPVSDDSQVYANAEGSAQAFACGAHSVTAPARCTILGRPAWHVRAEFAKSIVTSWYLECSGWQYGLYLHTYPPDVEADVLARTMAALRSWVWIPAAPSETK